MSFDKSSLDVVKQSNIWLFNEICKLTESIEHLTPVEFVEKFRYLVAGETMHPGLMDLDITPYWIKPLNQADPYDPTREIIIIKGVKTAYTTDILENVLFYFMAFLRVYSGMFISADKELAQSRLATNILPMLNNSGFGDIFTSNDSNASNKSGKTKALLEFKGGGNLVIEGAGNANKMRQYTPMFEVIDEFVAFRPMKNDGDTMRLLRDRCQGFWNMRKIIMGTTPGLKGGYPDVHYSRGNQQQYNCRCLKCGYPMWLKWSHDDLNKPEVKRGLIWEYKNDGTVDHGSIRYECWNCGEGHEEHHKERFINKNNSEWIATATPVSEGIESYHVPALISRLNPWYKHVDDYHEAYYRNGKIKSMDALKVFYNNVLGSSFEEQGYKLPFQAASSHRRQFYLKNEIPNKYAEMYCQSGIMVLLMTVDVQHSYLSVAVWGFTVGTNPWMIDYIELKDDSEAGCTVIESIAWIELQKMIDDRKYISDDGKIYWIENTFIDSGDGQTEGVVSDFCGQYEYGVYPTKGDSYSSKRMQAFKEFNTSSKATGYLIAVDMYKDRMAPVLRRQWEPENGNQDRYQLNVPMDTTDKEIKQLTTEFKKDEKLAGGGAVKVWYRPKGVKNELWDLLIMAMCGIEILALNTCLGNLGLEGIYFDEYWKYAENEQAFFDVED